MFVLPSKDAQLYDTYLKTYLQSVRNKIEYLANRRIDLIKNGEDLAASHLESKIEAYREVFDTLAKLTMNTIPTEIVNVATIQKFLQNPNRAQA